MNGEIKENEKEKCGMYNCRGLIRNLLVENFLCKLESMYVGLRNLWGKDMEKMKIL